MTELFEDLKTANQAGVYLLVSLETRECYINYSSNIAKSLVRLLSSNMYFPKFQFNILELVTNPINLRPRCQFYKDLYSSNGYVMINPKRVSNWKLSIDLVKLPDTKPREDVAIAVKLRSGAYRELIVGLFRDHRDVDEFIAANYSNGIYNIVYSNNALTQGYLKSSD